MTTGGQVGGTETGTGRRAVPDAENYLDLSGVEDESPGPHFDVVLRGYDRRQVDDHVAGLRRMVAQLRAQLAVRERRRSADEPTVRESTGGAAGPSGYGSGDGAAVPAAREPQRDEADDGNVEAFNDRLRGILQAAEQEAHAVRSKAAETLLAEHAESRAALADLRTQRDAVVDELVRLRGWLDEIVTHPGRTPSAPPPLLAPGPPRGRPWPPPPGPPPARPGGQPPAGRYGPAPWPPPAAPHTGPGSDVPAHEQPREPSGPSTATVGASVAGSDGTEAADDDARTDGHPDGGGVTGGDTSGATTSR